MQKPKCKFVLVKPVNFFLKVSTNCSTARLLFFERRRSRRRREKRGKKEHRSKFAFSAIVLFLSRSLVENGGHEEAGKREVFNLKTRLKVEN